MTELKRDPELDAALALAVLALLKSTEITTDVRDEEEPRIINFERAKAEISARRAQGAVTAQKERRQEPSRPRLRSFTENEFCKRKDVDSREANGSGCFHCRVNNKWRGIYL